METFEIGDTVQCVNIKPLSGNDVAPPLRLHTSYPVNAIQLDKEGNQHLDVGLKSDYNYIRSHETGEELTDGHTGYAGGLTPGNIVSAVDLIQSVDNPAECWMDLESGVRTNNEFDLVKVKQVLQNIEPFIV